MTHWKFMNGAVLCALLSLGVAASGVRGAQAVAAGVAGDEPREVVWELLWGAYWHSDPEIRARGAASVAYANDRPGVLLCRGEGNSGTCIYGLDADNPLHLIRLCNTPHHEQPGRAVEHHPASGTVMITSGTVEIIWDLAGGHRWFRIR
jgi:hypothetical protein